MIVALFGKPGVGKTHLATRVARETGWDYLAIDQFGDPGSDRWPKMLHALRQANNTVIVESNIMPPQYRSILNGSDHLIVEVTADEETRQRRMKARGRVHWSAKTATVRPDLRVRSGPSGVQQVIEGAEDVSRGWGGTRTDSIRHRAPSAEKNAYGLEGI